LTVTAIGQCGTPQSASITVKVNPVQPTNYYTLNWTAGTVGGLTGSFGYSDVTYSYTSKINAAWSGTATFDSTGKCLSVSTAGLYDIASDVTACAPAGCLSVNQNGAFEITAPGLLQDVLEILPVLRDDQGPYMVDPLFYQGPVDTSGVDTMTIIASGMDAGSWTNTSSWDAQGVFIPYVGPNVLRPDFATGTIFSKDYESTDETSGLTTFWRVTVTVQPSQQ
jgi:hypothetical protein